MSEMNFALAKNKEGYEYAQMFLGLAVVVFACSVKYIAVKYPKVGIGDTATDEAITKEIYKLIHSQVFTG